MASDLFRPQDQKCVRVICRVRRARNVTSDLSRPQGQECERLICLGDSSCLLATTTSTLVLVSWPGGALSCRRLAPPAGLLGGIGRRVSSLIWGSMQAAGAEEVRGQPTVLCWWVHSLGAQSNTDVSLR